MYRCLIGEPRPISEESPTGFVGFGIATTNALLQILEILSRCKQEERKSPNQYFKAAPAFAVTTQEIMTSKHLQYFCLQHEK